MKKYIYSFVTALLLIVLAPSCSEDYLDRVPTQEVSDESVFTTTENARAALNGIHRFMFVRVNPPNRQDGFGEGSIMIFMDMLGDDMVMSTTGNGWYVNAYRWIDHRTENFNLCDFPYRFYFRIIANVNAIINNIDNAVGPEEDKNEIKGQALSYRAFSYHRLIQLYGKRYEAGVSNAQLGVPLILESTLESFPRATVEEIYTQINADLDQAITLLENATPRIHKSHINLSVAKGLKARVALTQGLWAAAAQYAQEARADYSLMSKAEYTGGFNSVNNDEWMWGSEQIQDQQAFFASFFAYISHNFSSTFIRTNPQSINSELYDVIPDSDIRKENFALTGLAADEKPTAGSLSVPYQNRKFTAASTGLSIGDIVHMRAAEMYLIEAEANAHLGQDGAAANLLFELNSARDDNYVLSINTGQALLDEILLYRRIELWGEGFRFLDLKRLNLPLDRLEGVSNHNPTLTQGLYLVPAGDMRWEFLIPLSELNANDLMVQNPQ